MRRFAVFCFLVVAAAATSKWMRPNLDVPIGRLIENVANKVDADPKDAQAHYHLGRLHSMAFAQTKGNVQVYGTEKEFSYPVWSSVKVTRTQKGSVLSPTELGHLRKSLVHYRRAFDLDRNNGLYRLGLAWMTEQAAPFAGQLRTLPEYSRALTPELLRAEALNMYRRIYRLFLEKDLRAESHIQGIQDVYVSQDAGAGIIRLSPKLDPAEKRSIEGNLKRLSERAIGVTPLVFPLDRVAGLDSLLDPGRHVAFDLAGDGIPRKWSWVGPRAGILVWDPLARGRILSGRQLFGSATFWLFFDDGYHALASLDDNRDGWVAGRELTGVAVWRDANGNGVSEKGEVRPVSSWSIVGLRARGVRRQGVLTAPVGVAFSDGGSCPSYDWEPVSLPLPK